jgi:hypothetical protein
LQGAQKILAELSSAQAYAEADASANTITMTQTETVKAVMRGIRRVEPRIAGSFRGCEHRGRSAGRR